MVAGSKGKVVAAIKSGKYKTVAMMVGLTLVFFYNMPFEFWGINVAFGLLYLTHKICQTTVTLRWMSVIVINSKK